MIQNSLDVLVRGIAETLVARVVPEVDDAYARAQLVAAADLLTNLAPRISWERAYLLAGDAELRCLLREAAERGVAAPPGVLDTVAEESFDGSARDLEDYARRQEAALAALQRFVAPGGPAADPSLYRAVSSLVDRRLDAELRLLRPPARPPGA